MSYYDLQTSARYVQCPGALREIKRYTFGMGIRFLAVTSCRHVNEYVYSNIRKSYSSSCEEMLMPEIAEKNFRYNRQIQQAKRFDEQNVETVVEFEDFGGCEITMSRVEHLVERIRNEHFDCIIGVGGGKALDFARAAAYYTGVRVVLVPTAAATNASASPLCVIYNEEGTKQTAFYYLPNYQDLVIADTDLLIQSPARSFAAGIGDQICTYLEVYYTNELMGSKEEFPDLSWDVIDKSCEVFLTQGKAAFEAAKAKTVTHEYENVLSQVLFSNSHMRAAACSGFAHLLAKALILFPTVNKEIMHGEQVAYAILPMKIHQQKSGEDFRRYVDWCISLNFPVTFAQLGIPDVTEEELLSACREICKGPTAELPYTPEVLVECMLKAEKAVNAYLAEKK